MNAGRLCFAFVLLALLERDRASGESVTLKMSRDDAAPDREDGVYQQCSKSIPFTLVQR